jgi:WXG100 family type VII secretion target
MAQRIKIDPDQVLKIGGRFLKCSNDNISMANDLRTLIDGISGEWEGKSRERFYFSYKDAHKQLENVSIILKDVGEELNAIAERFRVADTTK